MDKQFTIGVLGAGAWGTALAIQLSRLHPQVQLWGRNAKQLQHCISVRENSRYLPGIELPENIVANHDLASLIGSCTHLVAAVPSIAMRDTLQTIQKNASPQLRGIIWATKGLEQGTGKFLHQVAEEELAESIQCAILSGPSFAQEVAQGLPTAVTIASFDIHYAEEVASLFHHPVFRTYTSVDVCGVEIGGTFKNILAIASGIIDGLHFGANARAALITRGVAEMTRFGFSLDINPQTLVGLSGLGDIVLSCTENLSRNRRLGLGLGAGKDLVVLEKEIGQILEGKYAAKVIHEVANNMHIELPISEQVYQVIYAGKSARDAVEELLARASKTEVD